MANAVNQQWLMGQLPLLTIQPQGIWGISYDVFTRPTEDDVPHGWQARRSETYRKLLKKLKEDGYHHHQYSDHCKMNIPAIEAFQDMIELALITPDSKLATTIKGMKMHYIDDLALLDVSQEVMLGGNVSTHLTGPAPRELVHRLVGAGQNLNPPPVPVPQGHPGLPPVNTSRTVASINPVNYVM
ncbi:hypothetical protein EIP91_004310 [Steccherinum ochraceum]|uniref:Uncharacterized protein n=1 Tax=Steccherinum ochraceum TaxID=92696 RepID=A0A4R0R922_9APHY|nr:hypothetical protein EIP91_004310 [Steccherinum ochraceum]